MPTTPIELLLLLLFVVPGFITKTVVSANTVRRKQNPQDWVVEILLYGGLNFSLFLVIYALALFLHLIRADEFTAFPPTTIAALIEALAYIIFSIFTPTLLGAGIYNLLNSGRLGFLLGLLNVVIADPGEPTAWDNFFSRRQQCWVVVTFKDGTRAGGFMSRNSSAATSVDGQDIYLEVSYNVGADGSLSPDPVPDSGGIWISGTEIKCLEFYLPPNQPVSQGEAPHA